MAAVRPPPAFGPPAGVADVAVYLTSVVSRYVTGESVVVDGGISNTAWTSHDVDPGLTLSAVIVGGER